MEILRTGGHGGGGDDYSQFMVSNFAVVTPTGPAPVGGIGPCAMRTDTTKCVTAADAMVGGGGGGRAARDALLRTAREAAEMDTASGASRIGSRISAEIERLAARTEQLAGILDPIARRHRASAVLGTSEGVDVLASGGTDLSRAQRALAKEGDLVSRSPGDHAEVTAVRAARAAGLRPRAIAVDRPICPPCQKYLQAEGATLGGPGDAWWRE
jgi:hypothetical protein